MSVASTSSTADAKKNAFSSSSSPPVALLEHLHVSLKPLLSLDIVPSELQADLAEFVKDDLKESSVDIPYDILLRVSRWGATPPARSSLKDAGLDPYDYMMLSLLAGTVTSPKAQLGSYIPPPSALEVRRAQVKDRRAVIALINALFSIAGVGVAAWHASKTTGWSPGTRITVALISGFIVAVAEGGLYAIWSSRSRDDRKPAGTGGGKVEPPIVSLIIPSSTDIPDVQEKLTGQQMRRRRGD